MSDAQLFEKIEAYLLGHLPQAEAQAFEQEIANDERLALEVKVQRLERAIINDIVRDSVKERLTKWQNEEPPKPPGNASGTAAAAAKNKRRKRIWLLLAAVLAGGVLAFIALKFWNGGKIEPQKPPATQPVAGEPGSEQNQPDLPQDTLVSPMENPVVNTPNEPQQPPAQPENKPPDLQKNEPQTPRSQQLAMEFAKYEPPTRRSSQNSAADSIFQLALAAFAKKDDRETLRLLDTPEAAGKSEMRYLRGHTWFRLKNFGEAAKAFESVATASGLRQEDAQWHLLLAYLAELPKTQAQFDQLKTTIQKAGRRHSHSADLEALLKKMGD